MSEVKLAKFDQYGTFRLRHDETAGIETLVHKLNGNEYLSRNAHYYPSKHQNETGNRNFRDLCDEYQRLNALLPLSGQPAFVVCEKMHELATRAVNTIQRQDKVHLFQDGQHFDTVAQKCAQECADNLVRLFHGQPALKTAATLREETRLPPDSPFDRKIVFADNKKQLYMCANALPDDTEHLITPGRGSSKLGTLVQAVRQQKGLKPLAWTQIYYSLYGNSQFGRVFPEPLNNLPEKLLVMDDFIYNGFTLSRIKKELTEQGHQVTNGAVTTAFGDDEYNPASVYEKANWADYIDIIPNQYANPWSDQKEMSDYLKHCTWAQINTLSYVPHDPHHTADYQAMKIAEDKAHERGADLYHASAKISPAAVDYNKKVRAQVKQYDAEYQETLHT